MRAIYNVSCTQILPCHKAVGPVALTHSMKQEKRESKGRLRANVLGYTIVNLWNSLSEDVVSAESVNFFKGRLDTLSVSRRFCEDLNGVFGTLHVGSRSLLGIIAYYGWPMMMRMMMM